MRVQDVQPVSLLWLVPEFPPVQMTTGIERFIDLSEMGASDDLQPDRFFYDHALNLIRRERGASPLFMFTYVTVNHFPWDWVFRPDLTPDWQSPGNDPGIDEYIRRRP